MIKREDLPQRAADNRRGIAPDWTCAEAGEEFDTLSALRCMPVQRGQCGKEPGVETRIEAAAEARGDRAAEARVNAVSKTPSHALGLNVAGSRQHYCEG